VIIYQNQKSGFLHDVHHCDIEEVIHQAFRERTGRKVSKEEVRSWASSLTYMSKVLVDGDIPDDCGVAIEYTIPQTAKRVDFLLTGKNAEQKDCLVIIELKQWDFAKKTEKDGIVETRFARGPAEVNHPSYQAWSYAALLEGYNEAVYDGGIRLSPCAYLHNYADAEGAICDSFYVEHIRRAPLFLKGEAERRRLQEFIKANVRYGDKGQILYVIEGGRIRPSKSLADALAGLMKGNPEFILIDDQKLVYETAVMQARKAQGQGKRVLIVEGGPGTGKSVVAINLLVGLTKAGLVTKYVTKNAAPRAVYEARLTGLFKKTQFSNLFVGSGAFTATGDNEFDALVVDEAHRLNEKSGLYRNLGEHQVKEIIRAARFCVFFVDESQKVTWDDVGDKGTIRMWAKSLGASVEEMTLASQFRCSGSDGYLAWLDNTLNIRETANDRLDVAEFDFRVVDSPAELRDLIRSKNIERNRARMVAGYCWKWPSKTDPAAFDIVMPEYGFQARWNLTKDGGLWMVSPNSVEEVGCIHTCQGLEVDYIGVIVGSDLVVRNGCVVTHPEMRASSDRAIQGWKQLAKTDGDAAREKTDAIIKNTYRTLLTRGMRGCFVYFTDPETADYFRSRLTRTSAKTVLDTTLAPTAVTVSAFQFRNAANEPSLTLLTREQARYIERTVPVVSLKIAAGAFSGTQSLEDEADHWVQLPEGFASSTGLFLAQVIGESMNKRIPNGAWCLFRANPAGSRQGKIVLVQHRDVTDPETGGSYTVKRYQSEKQGDAEGWQHERITLMPMSNDSQYLPLVLVPSDEGAVRVVAEWVAVIG
jgi:uncharacterized protein